MVRVLVDITEKSERTGHLYRMQAGDVCYVDARDLPQLGRGRIELVESSA